ncbi:MAG TPA: hypothetical protein VFV33_16860, partial [Gemmatimonadaceae bacterium]|nr:hypothetical protein [Gemmatimonadaceae bacterium]
MRFTLPESSHRRQRSVGGTLASAIVHAVAIGGTLAATGLSAEGPRAPTVVPENLVYVKSVDPPPAARAPRDRLPRPSPVPRPTDIVPPVAPPPVVIDPAVIPTGIPPVGATLGVPFDSTVRAANGALTDGTPSGTGEAGGPMTARTVDREVVPLRGVTPRYPAMLASAGLEGTVVLQFVVDTLGRVEPATLAVLR